jgi:2-polyprenyl-6-hydroxyphenyl methylase/3-demethylubiquinone-9 3-methyltransferase
MASFEVNNDFYDALGLGWFEGQDHPIALLRAEARLKNPWVTEVLRHRRGLSAQVLDIGCGGGLLSNHLAEEGFSVTGLDQSADSLRAARTMDRSGQVHYVEGSAYELPFAGETFDACTCMDVLEHVDDPEQVVHEASRVLRPGGVFLFHTFNRTWLSKLMVIYGVNWFFKNVPKNLHVYRYFIAPEELKSFCESRGIDVVEWRGLRPRLNLKLIREILRHGHVPVGLEFEFCSSLKVGYLGVGVRR